MRKFFILVVLSFIALTVRGTFEAQARIVVCNPDIEPCSDTGGEDDEEIGGDYTSPVLNVDTSTQNISAWNSTFVIPSCTAIDDIDGVLNCDISGLVNIYLDGTYYITFSATDNSGNTTQEELTVVVENPGIIEDLITDDRCSNFAQGPFTLETLEFCAQLKATHILLKKADNVLILDDQIYSTFGPTEEEYNCAIFGSDYVAIDQNLKGEYLYDTSNYADLTQDDFIAGDYYFEYHSGLYPFTHSDDYHEKYLIHDICQKSVNADVDVSLLDRDGAIFYREYIEQVSTFDCIDVAGLDPSQNHCHYLLRQHFVPVSYVLDRFLLELTTAAFEVDPSINWFGIVAPMGIEGAELLIKALIEEELITIGATGTATLVIGGVLFQELMLIVNTYQIINYVNDVYVEQMYEDLVEFIFAGEMINDKYVLTNMDRYIVFSESNMIIVNNSEGEVPEYESFSDNDIHYRYTIFPYSENYISHVITESELELLSVEDAFNGTFRYDFEHTLYSEIMYIDERYLEASDLFKTPVFNWTP